MKQYKIGVFFEKGYLVSSQINLVTEDYKSTEFIFEFDIEEGRKVFELKKPNGSKYIKDIVNNKITLVDYDTELNEISLIPTAGTYEFEIVNYTEDSKLTLQEQLDLDKEQKIMETVAWRCAYYRANPNRYISEVLNLSLKPFTSGSSGPTTTSDILFSNTAPFIASKSFTPPAIYSALKMVANDEST